MTQIITQVHIADSLADAEMVERVVAAANGFAERHNLTADQVNAIYVDDDHPLFDELDAALSMAAVEGFADRSYVVGEISDFR